MSRCLTKPSEQVIRYQIILVICMIVADTYILESSQAPYNKKKLKETAQYISSVHVLCILISFACDRESVDGDAYCLGCTSKETASLIGFQEAPSIGTHEPC